MNSSGIKRGLAVSAVSALAVAGVPALASSANAAVGDVINVAFTGPALNGGGEGAVVVLKTKGVVAGDLDLAGADLGQDSEDTPSQDVNLLGATLVADGAAGDSAPGDGFDEITASIEVTTPTAGATANFTIFEDEDGLGTVNAAEARAAVSIQTAGQVAQIAVTPATQTSAVGVPSAPYTVTLKDSAGRTTQLDTGDSITLTPAAGATTNESGNSITAAEIARGTDTFTATGGAVNVYNIGLATSGVTPAVSANATLDVVKSAVLTNNEVNIVTGADDWTAFGEDAFGGTTLVRVDQGSIRIDIKSDNIPAGQDANATVVLTVDGNGDVTFGGKATTTVTTVLNANGVGSLTITPDAGSVQENDVISVDGAFTQDFQFVRSAATATVPAADAYVSAIDGSVTVTATVVDQFGLPVTTGEISAARAGGPNPDATPQRKAVNASGQATFTFTDVNAVPGQTDTVNFAYFVDQFDNSPAFPSSTVIRYTADGKGSDFTTRIEGVTAAGAGYDPATNKIIPLADSEVSAANEAADLEVVNAEPSTEITVSVDNGALILEPGETSLSQGSASITDVVTAGGILPAGYQVIGTKAGLTTLTIVNAGRTETALFTVAGQTVASTARNVTVSGPATAPAGSLVTFDAVVTDAFGNPIAGVPVSALNVQVSGSGALQDTGAATDASGKVALNVRLQDDAAGPVTIQVTGIPGTTNNQFGAAADQLRSDTAPGGAAGLPVSANTATASVTAVAPPAPADAQLKVSGKGGKKDRVKANAISGAAGAKATLWVKGKKVKSGILNDAGNLTFVVKDKNGNKKTKYTVKITKTELSLADSASTRVR